MRISHLISFIMSIFIFFSPSLLGLKIEDRREEKGVIELKAEGWNGRFVKEEKGLSVCWHNSQARQYVKLIPFDINNQEAEYIEDLQVTVASEKEIIIRASFSAGNNKDKLCGEFTFTKDGMVTLNPLESMAGISIKGDIKYTIVPGLFLEDIVVDPREEITGATAYLPAEEIVAGLLGEGEGILICVWPEGEQKVRTYLSEEAEKPGIEGIEIELDGLAIHLGALIEQGIWHLAEFPEDHRDKDIELEWERPFNARWRTETMIGSRQTEPTRSVVLFSGSPSRNWHIATFRSEVHGPAWFEEDTAVFHFTGRFEPADQRAFIYPLENHSHSIMGFLKRTPAADFFDRRRHRPDGWTAKGRGWDHPREVSSVGFTYCSGTDHLRNTMLKEGSLFRESEQKFLKAWLDNVVNDTAATQNRRREYTDLLEKLKMKITIWKNQTETPEAVSFLKKMHAFAIESIDYHTGPPDIWYGHACADYWMKEIEKRSDRMKELARVPGTEYVAEYDSIATDFNGIAWGQQESLAEWGGWRLRKWFQKAGELSRHCPESVEYAKIIRKEIRRLLKRRDWETIERWRL